MDKWRAHAALPRRPGIEYCGKSGTYLKQGILDALFFALLTILIVLGMCI